MKVLGIDFVVLSVSNLEKAKHFYEEVLGIEDSVLMELDGWIEFDTHPVALSLGVPPPEFAKIPETAIALAVDDVQAAMNELREKGATVVFDAMDTSVCTMGCIADPDGNRIFIHKRHDGTVG